MKRKKRIWSSRIAALALAGCVLWMQTALPAYASETSESMGIDGLKLELSGDTIQITGSELEKRSFDSDGYVYMDYIVTYNSDYEILAEWPATVIDFNGMVLAYFPNTLLEQYGVYGYVLYAGATGDCYELEASDYLDDGDLNICMVVYEGGDEPPFQDAATCVQNQEVLIGYETGDGVDSMTSTLLEMDENRYLTLSDMPEVSAYYPATVYDSDLNIIGIVISDSMVWTPITNQEQFYANSSGSSGADEDTDDGDDADAKGGTDDESDAATDVDNGAEPEDSDNATDLADSDGGNDNADNFLERLGENMILKVVLVIIIACIAGLICAIVAKRKKKKGTTGSDFGGGDTVNYFADETVPADGGNNGYATSNSSEMSGGGGGQPVSIRVYGVGGYMDGRVYDVDGSEITFGRDVSNTIIFPADMKGISRRHCKVYFQDGMLMLMDCDSTYGTILEGYGKLTPYQPKALQIGVPFYLADKNNCFVIK